MLDALGEASFEYFLDDRFGSKAVILKRSITWLLCPQHRKNQTAATNVICQAVAETASLFLVFQRQPFIGFSQRQDRLWNLIDPEAVGVLKIAVPIFVGPLQHHILDTRLAV